MKQSQRHSNALAPNRSAKLVSLNVTFSFISLLFTFLSLPPIKGASQLNPEPLTLSPQGFLETVYDKEGNVYRLEDIIIDKSLSTNMGGGTCTNSGYFVLHYENGSGLEIPNDPIHQARRDVFCQLLFDLSEFIVPASTNNQVHIWVRNIEELDAPANALGLATSFYSTPQMENPVGGIVDGMVWQTINSGLDSYTNVVSPFAIGTDLNSDDGTFYHGMMAFNFNQPWHTDLTTVAAANEYDLYTVALHEITHALGFASLINDDGQSKLGNDSQYFSRYDTFLQASNGQNLLTNNTGCEMYGYAWNSMLVATETVSPNPLNLACIANSTECANAVKFMGLVNQSVYTPNCYEGGSSLSHLEDLCHLPNAFANDQYYVMSNATGTGPNFTKRYLRQEERQVLCDLGYMVETTFGMVGDIHHTYFEYGGSICNNNEQLAGINDGISDDGTFTWFTTPSVMVPIPGDDILSNDFGESPMIGFTCLEVIIGGGTLNTTQGNDATTINYTPPSNSFGIHLLRYIPTDGVRLGNITYIYVFVSNPNCQPSACDLINNGGFEFGAPCDSWVSGYTQDLECWADYSGSPTLFGGTGCQNNPITLPIFNGSYDVMIGADVYPGGTNNNKFLGCFASIFDNQVTSEEAAQSLLSSELIPNQEYHIRFWGFAGSSFPQDAKATFCVSQNPLATVINFDPDVLTEVAAQVIPHDALWHYYDLTFVCPNIVGLDNIIWGVNGEDYVGISGYQKRWAFIDDLSIVPSETSVFNIEPDILCPSQTISDLSAFVVTPNGIFSGPGVIENGGIYSFDASIAGLGTHTITYQFTNNLGCLISLTDQVTVSNTADLQITSTQEGSLCPTENATLSIVDPIIGAIYTWSPSAGLNSTTGSSVNASALVTTIYSVTTTNGDCTQNGSVEVLINETCCTSSSPPPTYTIDALAPDWIGVSYELDQDLIIQNGVNFVINNCTLKFAENKGIKLMIGADLTINNQSLLTTMDWCPGHWAGISAFQTANYTNAVDKNNLSIQNSTIEHAKTGVKLYTYWALGPYSTTNWASLNIGNSNFLNNRIDLMIDGGVANNAFSPIAGGASLSIFKTDANFELGYVPNLTKCSIKNLAKGINFSSCKFINEVPAFLNQFEFTACEYVSAPINMYGSSPNSSGIASSSQIVGFTRGIHATNTNVVSNNIYLRRTDMANWRDVYIRMNGTHKIEDNDFYNLQSPLMSNSIFVNGTLNYINQESGDPTLAPYGLYMDGAGATYTVLDNHFETTIQLPGFGASWAHGFIANNTGDFSNRVRRNTFTGMQRAMKLQGDNRTTLYTDGLKYSCNTFYGNLTDIRELNSNLGNVNTFGTPNQQSTVNNQSADPNNSFTPSTWAFGTNDDLSNTTTSAQANHAYVRLFGSQEPQDNETSDAPKIVFPSNIVEIDGCISNVQMLVGGGEGNNTNPSAQKSLAEINYEALQITYLAIVDGGNTEALLQEIQSTTYSEALQMYYDLMAQSPYVSEEALIEALKKYELPNVLLTQILSSNPHSAKSGRIKEEMDNRIVPFEEYQKAQINQGLTLFSSKESMELAMAGLLGVRGEALSELMSAIDDDDLIYDKITAKLSLLNEEVYYTDLLMKIDLFAANGQYEAARQLTNVANDYYRLMSEDKVDMEAMYDLLDIQEALNSSTEGTLTNSQEAALYEMLNTTSAAVSTKCLNLLIAQGDYAYLEPIEDDEIEKRDASEMRDAKLGDLLKVFPNPATNIIQISYPQGGAATLELFDALGQLVLQQSAQRFETQFVLNLGDLPSSLYELRLVDSLGSTLATKTFMKQ